MAGRLIDFWKQGTEVSELVFSLAYFVTSVRMLMISEQRYGWYRQKAF